jgi:hypothetical protein
MENDFELAKIAVKQKIIKHNGLSLVIVEADEDLKKIVTICANDEFGEFEGQTLVWHFTGSYNIPYWSAYKDEDYEDDEDFIGIACMAFVVVGDAEIDGWNIELY